MTECPVCAQDIGSEAAGEDAADWVLLGYIADNVSADYARETLKAYEVPAVVISKSGFFGKVGLILPSFYGSGAQLFEVMVPADYVEEAVGLMDMILGDKWRRKE
jgi:hypothetical protein